MLSIKKIRSGAFATALILAGAIAPAEASPLFSDTFDGDAPGSVLNFNAFANWNVANGSVDYLKGYPGISCLAGGCVDLDGSTLQAGRMISKQSFVLDASTIYRLSVTFSGSQRNGYGSDNIKWGITTGTVDWAYGYDQGIAWNAAFNILNSQFTGIAGTFHLFVEDTGSHDNVGTILDSISFQSLPSSVPEPGALALVGLGIAALMLTQRRFNAHS